MLCRALNGPRFRRLRVDAIIEETPHPGKSAPYTPRSVNTGGGWGREDGGGYDIAVSGSGFGDCGADRARRDSGGGQRVTGARGCSGRLLVE